MAAPPPTHLQPVALRLLAVTLRLLRALHLALVRLDGALLQGEPGGG